MREPFSEFHRIAASGRLGQPVFLRCQITSPPDRALTALAETLAAAAALFGDTPATLHASGDEAAGALHAVLVFHSGATVLACTGPGEEAVEGMLLGNHGAAYSAGPVALPDAGDGGTATGAADERARRLCDGIRAALSTGETMRLDV